MELIEAIETRRSIRHFNDKKLEKEKIIEILKAGILSPSAMNRQPWYFIIVNKEDLKNEISKKLLKKNLLAAQTCEVMKKCQSLILVFASIEKDLMDIQSVGGCIENMCLRATDLGVGSLWIGFIASIESDLQKMFDCNKKIIAALALGHMDKIPKPRPRKSLEEVSVWYE